MPVFRTVAVIQSPSLGGNGTNTFHFRTVGAVVGPPDGSALASATETLEAFYTAFQARFAGGTVITSDGIWTRVDDESGDVHDAPGFTVGPTSGGNPMPPQDSLVIGWRSASGGRSGRGRTFISPLSTACLESNGSPEEAARADLDAELQPSSLRTTERRTAPSACGLSRINSAATSRQQQ